MDNTLDKIASKRKDDHIALARESIVFNVQNDARFYYEPIISTHPCSLNELLTTDFLGKKLKAPFWVSSMTGGSERAFQLNRILASAAQKNGFGMGLGSCRSLINSTERFEDFNLRPILGDELPFYANLGVAQLEELLESESKKNFFLNNLENLDVDGLIIHVNPLQEWLQPEGDRIHRAPIETISDFISGNKNNLKIIVKEVGQGFGPKSMAALMDLPIDGIEFASFGGTNFSKLELLRKSAGQHQDELALVGHDLNEMIGFYHSCRGDKNKAIILSGGVTNFLDGFYFQEKIITPSLIGMAGEFLKYALIGEDALNQFMQQQVKGLAFAKQYLSLKEKECSK